MGPVLVAFAIAILDGQVSLVALKRNAPSRVIPHQVAVCKAPVCVLRAFLGPLAGTANAPRIAGDMGIASKVSVNASLSGLADPAN